MITADAFESMLIEKDMKIEKLEAAIQKFRDTYECGGVGIPKDEVNRIIDSKTKLQIKCKQLENKLREHDASACIKEHYSDGPICKEEDHAFLPQKMVDIEGNFIRWKVICGECGIWRNIVSCKDEIIEYIVSIESQKEN